MSAEAVLEAVFPEKVRELHSAVTAGNGGQTLQNTGDGMKKTLIAALIMGPLFAACVVVPPGHRGYGQEGVVIVPLLPSIVVLDAEPYYYQSGFYYHYNDNRWFYARSKNGPWTDLPRDHYPKEVRFKGRDDQHDRDRDHDNRDHDNRGR